MRLFSIGSILLFAAVISCTDRPRDNIFDPGSGIGTIDIGLRAIAEESTIRLVWSRSTEVRYDSVLIYRKSPGSTQFSLRVKVSAENYYFRDDINQSDKPYSYYLTLKGAGVESPPSDIVEAIAGPGDIWLLDHWNFEVLNLTYDLKTTRAIKYGAWTPENLSVVRSENLALVTYPSYAFFELFDPEVPYERLFGSGGLEHPFDVAYDHIFRTFWISDSSGSVHRLNPFSGSLNIIPGEFSKPTTIRVSLSGRVYILDTRRNAILHYSLSGESRGTLSPGGEKRLLNPQAFEINPGNGDLYIIDQAGGNDVLYRYTQQGDSLQELTVQPDIRTLAFDEKEQSIWITVRIDLNSKIMQLSQSGERLNLLEEFENPIDLAVNPYNGNLIIVDASNATVTHMRTDGSVIGTYNEVAQPYKVLIE